MRCLIGTRDNPASETEAAAVAAEVEDVGGCWRHQEIPTTCESALCERLSGAPPGVESDPSGGSS